MDPPAKRPALATKRAVIRDSAGSNTLASQGLLTIRFFFGGMNRLGGMKPIISYHLRAILGLGHQGFDTRTGGLAAGSSILLCPGVDQSASDLQVYHMM